MSPKILEFERCPHCKAELPVPAPRACPACGGSLQRRFLTCGCLSSAPPVLLLGLGLAWGLGTGDPAAPAATGPSTGTFRFSPFAV